jgi:dihydrofolate synthase/folylpolyglutamate synthase
VSGYREALSALQRLEMFGVRLGLENVSDWCEAAGHPERVWPAFHVAGTNGKGTTAACLAELARAHGLRAGLYTSPHLVDFRERIRVEGRAIPRSALVEAWKAVGPFAETRTMTFFEAGTLMAFQWFARSEIDVAVVEVGLGGRLDATNVVSPEICLVTNIALDHERHLGDDPVAIAREKAGIAKPGVPLLVGEAGSAAVRSALATEAAERGASIAWLEAEAEWEIRGRARDRTMFDYESEAGRVEGLELPLAGDAFVTDAVLALRAWERTRGPLDPVAAREALSSAAPAGRMEWATTAGVPVLLDVAHNPAALARLVEAAARTGAGRWTFVAGILADKRWTAMLDTLLDLAPRGRLCALETASPTRRLEAAAAAPALAERPGVRWAESISAAIEEAREDVEAGVADAILVTGSFHTVGEALVALGRGRPGRAYERPARALATASGSGRS